MSEQKTTYEPYEYSISFTVGSTAPSALQAMSKEGVSRGVRDNFEGLCNGVIAVASAESCTIISAHGTILAASHGDLPMDQELRTKGAGIAAVVWGGLTKIERVGGSLSFFTAVYEGQQFVGIPFPDARFAILVTVPIKTNPGQLRTIVSKYVESWLYKR